MKTLIFIFSVVALLSCADDSKKQKATGNRENPEFNKVFFVGRTEQNGTDLWVFDEGLYEKQKT